MCVTVLKADDCGAVQVDGTELEWAIGKMLYESMSAHEAPSNGVASVGSGSSALGREQAVEARRSADQAVNRDRAEDSASTSKADSFQGQLNSFGGKDLGAIGSNIVEDQGSLARVDSNKQVLNAGRAAEDGTGNEQSRRQDMGVKASGSNLQVAPDRVQDGLDVKHKDFATDGVRDGLNRPVDFGDERKVRADSDRSYPRLAASSDSSRKKGAHRRDRRNTGGQSRRGRDNDGYDADGQLGRRDDNAAGTKEFGVDKAFDATQTGGEVGSFARTTESIPVIAVNRPADADQRGRVSSQVEGRQRLNQFGGPIDPSDIEGRRKDVRVIEKHEARTGDDSPEVQTDRVDGVHKGAGEAYDDGRS